MTPPSATTRILHRVRRELAGMVHAHDVLWDNLTRLDPQPSPYLHWEPSATGWRLYGSLPPPGDDGPNTAGPSGPAVPSR